MNNFLGIIESHYHLWFIPMMIGIYICIPIIQELVRDEKVLKYFLIVGLVFWCLIPESNVLLNDFGNELSINIGNAIFEKITSMQLGLVMNYVFYFVLGYQLSRIKMNKTWRYLVYILGILGFVFTIEISKAVSLRYQTPIGNYYGYSRINVLLEALAVFELFKNIKFRNNILNSMVARISILSFGTYLVHVLIIELFQLSGIDTLAFNPIFSIPIIVLFVSVISYAISAIIHLVPGLNKYIV